MTREGLKNIAYKHLYEKIISYDYAPGDVIVEQEVSNLLGISRTPVREALKLLEQEGLVTHIPARGTFVKDITPQDVEEIMELRILFETAALKSAVGRIMPEELAELEKSLTALTPDSPDEEYYRTDRGLHIAIMRCSGNMRMIHFHAMIESQLERLRRISARTPDRLNNSKREHLEIVSALQEEDLEKATECLVKHLENIKLSTLQAYHSMRMNATIRR